MDSDTESENNYDVYYEENDNGEGWYYLDDQLPDKTELPAKIDDPTLLYRAVVSGDLETVQAKIEQTDFSINKPLKGSDTLPILHIACREGHLPIIKYLVLEKKADVNAPKICSTTLTVLFTNPSRKEAFIAEIVDFLLDHGADCKAVDMFGTTPLMYACRFGYLNVISKLVEFSDLNALDNHGYTALHYAIENHHVKAVMLLLDAGCNWKQMNRNGFTPLQFAQINGFQDIVEILPKDKHQFLLPPTHTGYFSLADCIPSIDPTSYLKRPEYFPEISIILSIYNLENLLEHFFRAQISLRQFLCMGDSDLLAIGIKMPFYRQYVEKALLDFHMHHWTMDSIATTGAQAFELSNFTQVLMIMANHLQNLIIIQATLLYVCRNLRLQRLGVINNENAQQMIRLLHLYKETIRKTSETVKHLCNLSPDKPPLHIDYENYLKQQKRQRLRKWCKYGLLAVGFTVYVGFKLKSFFHHRL